jgi:hypothetical protein
MGQRILYVHILVAQASSSNESILNKSPTATVEVDEDTGEKSEKKKKAKKEHKHKHKKSSKKHKSTDQEPNDDAIVAAATLATDGRTCFCVQNYIDISADTATISAPDKPARTVQVSADAVVAPPTDTAPVSAVTLDARKVTAADSGRLRITVDRDGSTTTGGAQVREQCTQCSHTRGCAEIVVDRCARTIASAIGNGC